MLKKYAIVPFQAQDERSLSQEDARPKVVADTMGRSCSIFWSRWCESWIGR